MLTVTQVLAVRGPTVDMACSQPEGAEGRFNQKNSGMASARPTSLNDILQTLRQHDALIWAWRPIGWAAAAYLITLGALIFVRPTIVHRFFDGFANSWGANFLEAVLRLIVALAFIGISSETKLPSDSFPSG
jgi:hypothetical protein